MTRKRSLSDEERTLWDTVTRAIKPLRKRKPKIEEPPAAAAPKADAKAALKVQPKTPPKFVKPAWAQAKPSDAKPAAAARAAPPLAPPPLAPLGKRMRSKLGRGTESIDDRIDLHGMTQADAHAALSHFLRRAQHDGARVVLVITGKGARPGSDPHAERGVLKRQVPHWLESAEMRPFIVGYESAGIGHGGTGALYVRVRRSR
jgi:DNA-nicking Smr family endonuclease